jgi:carboxymethylenebutenolidase
MNIFRPLICKWTEVAALAGVLALAGAAGATGDEGPAPPRHLLPFLEEFKAPRAAVLTQHVGIVTAVGKVDGFLARPDVREALPAVVLIPNGMALQNGTGLQKWMRQSARDLAGIGYVVLAVDVRKKAGDPLSERARERTLAELSAAVRWLRRRSDVLPERVGVVGWSWGGEQALALAATTSLQACVVCDSPAAIDAATRAGLRSTPVLGIFGQGNEQRANEIRAFQKALAGAAAPRQMRMLPGLHPGFMDPEHAGVYSHEAAEQAWLDIYEFLGKYVEDPPIP